MSRKTCEMRAICVEASRSISRVSASFSLPGGRDWSIWMSEEMEASGLLTSCATPAASAPAAASFSVRMRCSFRARRRSMSSAILRLISLNEAARSPTSSLLLSSTCVP